MTKGYCTHLPGRAGITVSGADTQAFLQGLITQDIENLSASALLYSALLTPQGRMDFDFFIQAIPGGVLLDCEAARVDALVQTLSRYKLRKDVNFTQMSLSVFAVWGVSAELPRDPRHATLGYRIYSAPEFEVTDFSTYDLHRIGLGVPDGSRDIAWGEDTVADINLEKLNGVSYTKGCYMGQELTSRMHHRALSKKGLYTVTIKGDALPPFTNIVVDGYLIGDMRSSCGDKGIAMLRHESVKMAERIGLAII
jgi:folate-binding protein YgfZ